MRMLTLQLFAKAGALTYTYFPPTFSSTTILWHLESHTPTQEHLVQETLLASKRLLLDLVSETCRRPRLAGEEGMHHLELLIIIYQAGLLQQSLGNCIGSLNLHTALWVNTPNPTLNYLKIAYSWLGSCLCKIAYSKPQIASPVEITFPHSLLYLNEMVSKWAPISLRKKIHFKRSNKTVSFLQWKGS